MTFFTASQFVRKPDWNASPLLLQICNRKIGTTMRHDVYKSLLRCQDNHLINLIAEMQKNCKASLAAHIEQLHFIQYTLNSFFTLIFAFFHEKKLWLQMQKYQIVFVKNHSTYPVSLAICNLYKFYQ